jgi:hypothetical protein
MATRTARACSNAVTNEKLFEGNSGVCVRAIKTTERGELDAPTFDLWRASNDVRLLFRMPSGLISQTRPLYSCFGASRLPFSESSFLLPGGSELLVPELL